MNGEHKIYVDAGQSAALWTRGRSFACPTLDEAVREWHRLPAGEKEGATIKVTGSADGDGALYTAIEIPRLHYGPKP